MVAWVLLAHLPCPFKRYHLHLINAFHLSAFAVLFFLYIYCSSFDFCILILYAPPPGSSSELPSLLPIHIHLLGALLKYLAHHYLWLISKFPPLSSSIHRSFLPLLLVQRSFFPSFCPIPLQSWVCSFVFSSFLSFLLICSQNTSPLLNAYFTSTAFIRSLASLFSSFLYSFICSFIHSYLSRFLSFNTSSPPPPLLWPTPLLIWC